MHVAYVENMTVSGCGLDKRVAHQHQVLLV